MYHLNNENICILRIYNIAEITFKTCNDVEKISIDNKRLLIRIFTLWEQTEATCKQISAVDCSLKFTE